MSMRRSKEKPYARTGIRGTERIEATKESQLGQIGRGGPQRLIVTYSSLNKVDARVE